MTGLVDRFVEQVIANSGFEEMDALYLRNRVLALVGDQVLEVETELEELIELKNNLTNELIDLNEKIQELNIRYLVKK